jgi:hypothetical protein
LEREASSPRDPGIAQGVPVGGANLVKHRIACRFPLAGSAEAIGKFLAFIGEHFRDDEWRFLNQIFQKPLCETADFEALPDQERQTEIFRWSRRALAADT